MKAFRFAVLLTGALLIGPAAAQVASYACASASTLTERAICATPSLGSKDVIVATYYDVLMHLQPATAGMAYREFRDDQHAIQQQFLAARDACGANVTCLNQRYDERIAALRATTQRYGAVVFDQPANH